MKTFLCVVACVAPFAAAQDIWGDETRVSVGLSTGVAPRYMGADEMRLALVPQVNVSRGIFFADLRRGLGVQYRSDNGFYARSSVAYDWGRADKNDVFRPGSDRLQGMGEVKGSALWNVTLAQEVASGVSVNGEVNVHLGGQDDRGHDFRVGVEGIVFASDTDSVKLNTNVHGGDGDFHQTFFGVSPAQTARSRFAAFDAGKGVYAWSAGAAWERKLDKHWSVGVNAQLMQLTGDAADSPLVERKASATALATVKYSF